MFCNCLAVGAGGALGAVCRYGMSLLPVLQRGAFLFYLQGRRAQRNIRAAFHTCVEAADALQAGDEAVFVQKLTDSYRLILERARQRFIEAGLPGAAGIVLP